MKKLKFHPQLIPSIFDGTKTSTWRIYDDKNLTQGDELIFVNAETLERFATAEITQLKVTTFGKLTAEDLVGHEDYGDIDSVLAAYRNYYPQHKVDENTELKIVRFKLLEK